MDRVSADRNRFSAQDRIQSRNRTKNRRLGLRTDSRRLTRVTGTRGRKNRWRGHRGQRTTRGHRDNMERRVAEKNRSFRAGQLH